MLNKKELQYLFQYFAAKWMLLKENSWKEMILC